MPKPAESLVSIAAVGDLQLGDSPTSVGYGFYSRYSEARIDDLLTNMRSAISGADVLFGNLETTLVPPPAGSSSRSALQLRGRPEFAAALRRAGFTILNVANNHAVQHGDETFHATVATVRGAGISVCGVRGTDGWASEPARFSIRGTEVGVLGYCLRPRQYGSAVPPYAEGTTAEIVADVKRLEQTGATVIVSLHWGEEFVPQPSEDEIAAAHGIIDAGATLILGHHPHVARPVEHYKSAVIAYSLGNFMGDMVWYPPFRRGLVLRCAIGESQVTDVSVSATRLGDDYLPSPDVAVPTVPEGQLRGLEAGAYQRAIDDTIRRQRIGSYRAALVNLPRTPARILAQLATDTLRNKVSAVAAGLSRKPSQS